MIGLVDLRLGREIEVSHPEPGECGLRWVRARVVEIRVRRVSLQLADGGGLTVNLRDCAAGLVRLIGGAR